MTPTGFEQIAENSRNIAVLEKSGAESGARSDGGLSEVVAAWPDLSEKVRAAVLALVRRG
jgi:hypothetical protein